MAIKQLWVEKYRPQSINDYVFQNETNKEIFQSWVKEKSIPNILLSGSPGVGKSAIANVLINELDVFDSDILYANGSKEGRKIEWIDKLIMFCSTMPFGEFKLVVIDEADYTGQNTVQPALRNLMEEYNNVRFIMTCNYPQRLIPALHSRCQHIHIDSIDKTEYTTRVAEILLNENVTFDIDVLDNYVAAFYPDLRKCINTIQLNSSNGSLAKIANNTSGTSDYMVEAVSLFKSKKIREARQKILSNIRPDEIDDLFKWCYNNLELFADTDEGKDAAILTIRTGLVNHAVCADPEINLAAMLIELTS